MTQLHPLSTNCIFCTENLKRQFKNCTQMHFCKQFFTQRFQIEAPCERYKKKEIRRGSGQNKQESEALRYYFMNNTYKYVYWSFIYSRWKICENPPLCFSLLSWNAIRMLGSRKSHNKFCIRQLSSHVFYIGISTLVGMSHFF